MTHRLDAEFALARDELLAVFDAKYRRKPQLDWGPQMRLDFDYFNPDDQYEALLAKLVKPGLWWADVGCGRDIFPSNPKLAAKLAQRCGFLYGVDPDPNVLDNAFVTERFQGLLQDCVTPHRFDLITLRMVAEHITEPDRTVAKLAELTRPGGLVIVYTPNKFSPVSMLAALVPNRYHFRIKRIFWGGEERDTFPTAFKMNTRRTLLRLFRANRFEEVFFSYLDDCRTFNNFRWLNFAELGIWKMLSAMGLHYPENCLLGAYRKQG